MRGIEGRSEQCIKDINTKLCKFSGLLLAYNICDGGNPSQNALGITRCGMGCRSVEKMLGMQEDVVGCG